MLAARTIIHKGDQDKQPLEAHPIVPLAAVESHYAAAHGPMSREQAALLSTPGELLKLKNYCSAAKAWTKDAATGVSTIPIDDHDAAAWFALQYAPVVKGELGKFDVTKVIELLMPSEAGTYIPAPDVIMVLPSGNDIAREDGNGYFHIDSSGMTCFSAAEAAKTSAHVAAAAVLAEVQTRIAHTAFELPQWSAQKSAFFCNEAVYGNMNLVWVSGAMQDRGGVQHGR